MKWFITAIILIVLYLYYDSYLDYQAAVKECQLELYKQKQHTNMILEAQENTIKAVELGKQSKGD